MDDRINFYCMEYSGTGFARAIELENKYNIWECEKCESIFVNRLSDLKIYFKGKKLSDYYFVSNYNIISKNLQDKLIEHKITGFRLRNINVEGWYDSKGNSLNVDWTGLKEIEVLGRGGYLRHKDGRIVEKCSICGAKDYKKQDEVEGLSVNVDEWDKSDIFYFNNLEGVIIVTENVKSIIERYHFANVGFLRIDEFNFM